MLDQLPTKTNEELIIEMKNGGWLKTMRIIEAWRAIDRQLFVPAEYKTESYENIPLPIGYGQTISQPLTVAIMLESLLPQPGHHVLDIGAGSGWVAALLGWLVGPHGSVVAIERVPQLLARAKQRIKQLALPQVKLLNADASRGWPNAAPYDIIHVAAAVSKIPPALKEQLADGGRLLIPVGQPIQDLVYYQKVNATEHIEKRLPGFQFVPLISQAPKD